MIRLTAAFALLLVASAYRVRRDTRADIEAMVQNSFKAFGEGDFEEKCKSVFDENAKFIGSGGKIHDGSEEICNFIKHKSEMFKQAKKMDYTVDQLIEEGDLAIAFATLTCTHPSPSDPETDETETMKELQIFKKAGGSMKLLVAGAYRLGDHHHHGHDGHHHGHDHTHGDSHEHRVKRETAGEKLAALMAKVKELKAEGKLDEIVDLVYADNIKMYTPKGKIVEGKEAVKEFYKQVLEKFGKPQVEVSMKHIIEEGDMAIAIGEKTMTITKDGEEKTKKATFITVFKADGDSYKAVAKANFYRHHHHGESSSEEN